MIKKLSIKLSTCTWRHNGGERFVMFILGNKFNWVTIHFLHEIYVFSYKAYIIQLYCLRHFLAHDI